MCYNNRYNLYIQAAADAPERIVVALVYYQHTLVQHRQGVVENCLRIVVVFLLNILEVGSLPVPEHKDFEAFAQCHFSHFPF